jgi:hypothetical protein
LIDAHADVNAKDQNGGSVLDWSAQIPESRSHRDAEEAGAKSSSHSRRTRPRRLHAGCAEGCHRQIFDAGEGRETSSSKAEAASAAIISL